MRRLLVLKNADGKRERLFWHEGVLKTTEAFERVMAEDSTYSLVKLRISGTTFVPREKYKASKNKINADDARFLGIQSIVDYKRQAEASQETTNEAGEVIAAEPKRTREASGITSETIKRMVELAEAGKTLKEAETELGISYPNLYNTAKKEGIVFKAGQRGRKAGVKITKQEENTNV